MWYSLKDENFTASVQNLYASLVQLREGIQEGYRKVASELIDEVESFGSLWKLENGVEWPGEKDGMMKRYHSLIFDSMGLLRLSCPRKRLLMYFSIAQRRYLEYRARFEWLSIYYPRVTGVSRVLRVYPPQSVVGAIVDNLPDMEVLCSAGIPVWLVLPANRLPELCIDKEIAPIVINNRLSLRDSDDFVTISEAQPPFPIIYDGMAAEIDRYQAMGSFLSSYASHGRMGFVPENTSTVRLRNTLGPKRTVSQRGSYSKAPYIKQRHNPNRQEPQNKFHAIDSPLMPTPLPNWQRAQNELGEYPLDQPKPLPGMSTGYWYPEPGMFVSKSNESTTAAFFTMWLHLRQLMLYRVRSSDLASPLLAKQWKTMLSMGFAKPRTINSTRASDIGQCSEILRSLVEHSEISLDMDNFSKLLQTSVTWKSNTLQPDVTPPPHVTKEILWELTELNYRQEFLCLDYAVDRSHKKYFNHDASILIIRRYKEDRMAIINNACWPDCADNVYQAQIPRSLASTDFATRLHRLRATATAMSTWLDAPPFVVAGEPKWTEGEPVTEEIKHKLDKWELEIARFYTASYLVIFGRAASIPHRID